MRQMGQFDIRHSSSLLGAPSDPDLASQIELPDSH